MATQLGAAGLRLGGRTPAPRPGVQSTQSRPAAALAVGLFGRGSVAPARRVAPSSSSTGAPSRRVVTMAAKGEQIKFT